jgi:hypothetical protein
MENNTTSDENIVIMCSLFFIFGMIVSIIIIYNTMINSVVVNGIDDDTDTVETVDIESNINEIVTIDDENLDCSICLNTYETVYETTNESIAIKLSMCGHKFHLNCILGIKLCPNCRRPITT